MAEAKSLGCAVFKLRAVGRAGFPDVLVLHPSRNAAYVELKTKRGRLSKGQTYMLGEIRQHGGYVQVLYGKQECADFLLGYWR